MCALKGESDTTVLRSGDASGASVRPALTTYGDITAKVRFGILDPSGWSRPPLTDWLVQHFLASTPYLPQMAQRLLDPFDLPPGLERIARRAQRGGQSWFAWADGPRIYFFVMQMVTVQAQHCRRRGLRMFFYDQEGRFVSWGTWALQPGGRWELWER